LGRGLVSPQKKKKRGSAHLGVPWVEWTKENLKKKKKAGAWVRKKGPPVVQKGPPRTKMQKKIVERELKKKKEIIKKSLRKRGA